jgi:hypothetical protein
MLSRKNETMYELNKETNKQMIKRIIILLKILFKMSDSLYMLNAQIKVISLDTQSF